MTFPLRVAYIGNFGPEHSTENHVARALRNLGHEVVPLQEDDPTTWIDLASTDLGTVPRPDLVLWTRTWHLQGDPQLDAIANLRALGIPTVGYHLDRWWGLAREHQIHDEPFFKCDLMVTADGGNDDRWAEAGIDHLWMPPAVLADEAQRGTKLGKPIPVGFVGSWDRYHHEWPWRRELVTNLARTYRHRFAASPRRGQPAVRGADLANLYATISVVVGDSCLAGGATHYWSDRIPETLGRGGFLIHPYVEGIEDHFTDGEHLILVEPGNWPAMREAIDRWLIDPRGRDRIAAAGREHVLAHHTYEHRMAALIRHLKDRDMIPDFLDHHGVTTVRRGTVESTFDLRPDSTDAIVVAEVWDENVYDLTDADVTGKVVLDIGGNIGAFSLWAAAAGAARVLTVEPATENLDALRRNIDLNWAEDRIDVIEVAVTDRDGTHEFFYDTAEPGGSHLAADGAGPPDGETSVVQTVPLAALVDKAGGHVDLCKIDVEGGEYLALTAASLDGTLDRIDRIVGEWHHLADAELAGYWFLGLLRHGRLVIFGDPEHGGQFDWRRYGS